MPRSYRLRIERRRIVEIRSVQAARLQRVMRGQPFQKFTDSLAVERLRAASEGFFHEYAVD